MKPIRSNRFLAIVFTMTSACAQAASLTWDGNGATLPNPNGGSGTWDAGATPNWWNGSDNVLWPAASTGDDDALFGDTAGAVTIAVGGVTANDITFNTSGYTIGGGILTLDGAGSVINTATGVTATINSLIAGSTNVTKSGAGTLVFGNANSFTGKTAINGGTLSINADNKLGPAPGTAVADQLSFDGGTLLVTAGNLTLNANRGLTLNSGGGAIDTAALGAASNLTVNVNAVIAGTGPLTLKSHGNMTATGGGSNTLGIRLGAATNTFTGDITVTSGLVSYAGNNSFGNAANKIILNGGGLLDNNANLALSRNIEVLAGGGTFRTWGGVNVAWSGAITGPGNINRTDGGTLTLSGNLSGYSGTYNNQGGFTRLTGTAATIGGNWTLSANNLTVDSTATQTLAGTISGAGSLVKAGSGNLALTPAITGNTYAGTTTVNGGGTLTLGQNKAASTGAITVNGSKLALTAGSGLHEGSLSASAINTTALNPATAVRNGTPMANTNTGWSSNQQWNYSGYIFVAGINNVNWSFGANIDDATYLTIDGRVVINNSVWNTVDVGTINLTPGWHRIDARFQNAGGGAGAHTSSGNNWNTTKGFGLDQTGAGSLNANNYTILSDPGDGSFLTQDLIVANNIALTSDSEINVTSGATVSGIISGSGTLALTGSPGSMLTLSGINTYTGAVTLGAGTVNVSTIGNGGVAGNLGAASNTATNLVFDGSTLRYTGATSATDRNFVISSGKTATIEVFELATNLTWSGSSTATNGALTKTGAGTLILTGANPHTGATTVGAGTLSVNGSLASPVTVNTGAALGGSGGSTSSTLTLAAGSTMVGVPSVAGAGNAFRAAGTVTVGANVLVAGTDGANTVGSHTIDVLGYGGTSPGTANFSTAGYRPGSGLLFDDVANQKISFTYTNALRTWNSISSTWDNQITAAWQEGDQRFATGDAVVFNDTGVGANGPRTVTLNSAVTPAAVTFNPIYSSFTLSGTGAVAGLTSLAKTGPGTVTLSSSNSYTGGTTISGGQLQIRNSVALGTGSVTVTGGGLLSFGPSGMNVANHVTLNGGILSGGMDSGTVNNTHSGGINLGAAGGTLTTWWSDKTLTVAGPITGAGNLTVNLQQAGNNAPNILLTGENTYSGTTTVTNGVLSIGNAAYQAVNYSQPIITGGTSGTFGTGDYINNSTMIIARINDMNVSNSITGTGNLIIRSRAVITFSGTSSLSGNTLFIRNNQTAGGTVVFDKPANSNAINFSTVYLGGERGGIYGNSTNLILAASEQIADTSILRVESGRYGAPSIFSLMGNNETIAGLTYEGSDRGTGYVQNNSATTDSTLTINTPAGTTYSYFLTSNALIRDGAAAKLHIVKSGDGTQVFHQADYTGNTTINAGVLRIQSGRLNASPTTLGGGNLEVRSSTVNATIAGASGQVIVSGGANSNFGGGSLSKTYTGDTIISGAGTALTQSAGDSVSENSTHEVGAGTTLNTGNFGAWIKGLRGSGTVNLGGTSANLTIVDGASQTFTGLISGAGKLTKEGPGSQTLSGANTFTGGTLVSGGRLVATDGFAMGAGGLIVAGGAFSYQPAAAGALDLGAGVLELADGSRIGTAVGGTLSQSAISSTSSAVAAGSITVDLHGIPGIAPTSGSNNLIVAGGGLNGATYTLGNLYNTTNFTVGALAKTDTAVSITISPVTPATARYWKGGFTGAPAVWAISNGTSASNWASTSGGTATSLVPGPDAVVHFSATGATNQAATTLGANMSVAGIVVSSSSPVGLGPDGHLLSLGGSGITVNSGAGAVTLGSAINLTASQAWQNGSSNTLTISGNVSHTAPDLTITGTGNTLVSGNLAGTGMLTKDGTGTLTLAGINANTGLIVIDGGTLKAGSTTAFAGLPQVDLTAAPGVTFDITSLNTTVGSISGGGPAGGTILLGGSTLTTGGNNGSTAFSGTISGVGGLTKTGTGSLTIGGTNNYTGTTRVSQGILILDAAAPTVLGGFVMSGADGTHARMAKPDQFGPGVVATFTSASGAWNRFDLLGKSQTLAGIQTGSATAQGGGVIQNRQQGNTTESSHGPVTLTLNGAGDYLFNGHLRNVDGGTVGTDTLALVKSGTGTQTLQGNVISYTGATTVSAGTLRLTNTTAFASPINNSATVDFVVNTTTNFGGNVAISGAGTYNKTGPATLVFNGTQAITATGQINIQQGTLQNNNNAVNWSGNKADIDVSAGAILDLYADPIFLDALTGSGIVQNNFGNASPAQSGASAFIERLVLGTNDGSGTFAGVIRDNATNQTLAAGAGRGGLQLEKTGSGTQTLAGVNTYTGITKVAAGTLLVNGSLAAGSAVTVESGATLGGSGTAAGTIAANGSIAPGTSIGTLATGTVTFGTTGSLDAEINSSTLLADKLAITGNLNLDPAAQLNLTDLGSGTPASAKFVLITYTGTWDGNAFAGTNDGGTVVVNGNTYTIDYNDIVGGTNAVTLNLGAGDPFDAWATANNITGGKGGDDDGDGVKNLLEFAAASNPNPATGGASSGPRCYPLMHAIGADKALTYTIAVRKGDLSAFAAAGNKQTATRDRVKYTIEASNTLADGWNTVQVTKVTGATATAIQTALGSKLDGLGADWEWHTFRTDAGAPADPGDFIRLKVEEAQ